MNSKQYYPPRWSELLLRMIYKKEDLPEKLGDFAELFHVKAGESGRFIATCWYLGQILQLLRGRSELSMYWRTAMLKNYLLIALRNLRRHKGYSIINITGLALGIAAFFIISVWVLHELSYDRFHAHAPDIYRITNKQAFPDNELFSSRTPGPLSAALMENFPEVKMAARHAWTGERVLKYQEKKYYENFIVTVDPEFFSIFSFPFIQGDRKSALADPFSAVLTRSHAEKYFGSENPIGKVITLDNRLEFKVTAVIEDVPANSHLQFDMVVPFEVVEKLGWDIRSWDFCIASTYVCLGTGSPEADFAKKIHGMIKAYDPETNIELYLQPLTRIRLFSEFDGSPRIQYVYVFSLVGILILLMASINFMNLTTARSAGRSLEIGVRKVLGAARANLVRQFLTEAVLIALAALVFAPLLVQLFLPKFNELQEHKFAWTDFADPGILLLLFAITLVTGLLSGSYPALFLSSFQPVKALQKRNNSPAGKSYFRSTLVLVQISISLVLIFVSAIVYGQVSFLKNKNLGYDKEQVITIPLGISNRNNSQLAEQIKSAMKRDPRVENVSASFTHPMWFATPSDEVMFNGSRLDENIPINITSVDFNFIETLKINIIAGRSFAKEFGTERGNLIINERFAELMQVDDPLGETLQLGDEYEGKVVGIMQDFHVESVAGNQIGPLILFHNPGVNYIYVRSHPGNISAVLDSLKSAWNDAAPELPFKYNFLDEELDQLYWELDSLSKVIKYFTLMAGFIACLGLFGLTSFATENRTKEIGIRKIMGSTVSGLIILLCRDFVKLLGLAALLALPLSWWLTRGWLQNFAYRVFPGWETFLFSGLLALGIALLTMSFQTIRAALADPIDSLRYE